MTKKYLILPQNGGDKFRQLLASMPGTAQEQKIMQEIREKTNLMVSLAYTIGKESKQ